MKAMPKFTPNLARFVESAACPLTPSGKLYYGFAQVMANLKAWNYLDEVVGSEAGSVSIATLDGYTGFDDAWFGPPSTLVFLSSVTATGRECFVTWTIGGALAINELWDPSYGNDPEVYAWGVLNGVIYGYLVDNDGIIYPFSASVGNSGANGAGFTALLGTTPPDPVGVDPAGIPISDLTPSATLTFIQGSVYTDWSEGVSLEPGVYTWPPNMGMARINGWGVDAEVGQGNSNIVPILGYGGVRVDPTGDRVLIFNSTSSFRACGLPTDWVGDMNGESRPAPNGDLFQTTSIPDTYIRIPAAYLAAGVSVSDECDAPLIHFQDYPGGSSAPDMFARD